jgi:hypothetical protein
VNAYEDLPTGKTWVSMAFSGDLVAAPEYLPKGLNPEVLGYWFPLDGRGTVGNDLMTILRSSRNPVLAHHFLNFLLDFDMAMLNLEWNGFQPPLVRIDPSVLVKQGYIPSNLTTAVVRQEYFETGSRPAALSQPRRLRRPPLCQAGGRWFESRRSRSLLPREQRFSVDLGLRGQVTGDVECPRAGSRLRVRAVGRARARAKRARAVVCLRRSLGT